MQFRTYEQVAAGLEAASARGEFAKAWREWLLESRVAVRQAFRGQQSEINRAVVNDGSNPLLSGLR